jgi:hypothetical protein
MPINYNQSWSKRVLLNHFNQSSSVASVCIDGGGKEGGGARDGGGSDGGGAIDGGGKEGGGAIDGGAIDRGRSNNDGGGANGGGRLNCGGAMGIVETVGGGAVVVVGGGRSAGGGRRGGGGAGFSVASIFSTEIIGLRTAKASDLSFSATVELDEDSRVGTVLLDSVDKLASTFRRQHRR